MWRDLAWVLDMLQASQKALNYAPGLSEEQFGASSLHQDAILRQLTIVGEAAKRVSVEFRVNHHGFRGGTSRGSAMSLCMIMHVWTCRKSGASFTRNYQP
jgi:Protein of unknown function DUF86